MAHADYNCCAICDCKLDYMGLNARKKEDICPRCLAILHEIGVKIFNVEELKEFIKKTDPKVLLVTLAFLGFCKCYYKNEVDTLVAEKGIKFDKNGHIILPDKLEEEVNQ